MSGRKRKSLFLRARQWQDGIPYDIFTAFGEALCVLIISSISLTLLSINYGLETAGIGPVEAFRYTFASTLQPTQVITYVAGILSSTTAFFLLRLPLMRPHIVRLILIIVVTGFIFVLATPLFIAGLKSQPANAVFATDLATILGLLALAVWLYSLYSQRRILERGSIDFSGDRRGREIADKIENS